MAEGKIWNNLLWDSEFNLLLNNMGFKVLRYWGHQIKDELNWCLNRVLEIITNEDMDRMVDD